MAATIIHGCERMNSSDTTIDTSDKGGFWHG